MRINSGFIPKVPPHHFENEPCQSLQKKTQTHHGEGQVHPIARSKLPRDPDVNANQFWVHPESTALHHFENKQRQLRPCSPSANCSAFLQLSGAQL
jgi:hypothetical protein